MDDDTIPDRYDVHMWRFMEPHVNALLDGAGLAPGESVLDVACGTGFVARTAVQRGAPRVAGADVNPAMLSTARRTSDEVIWMEAPGSDLPLGDQEFDLAVCSQGLQFFPDPAAGLREMARVASRLAVTMWAAQSDVPWFDAHIPMLHEVCGVDPSMTAMSFNSEERVRDWFAAASLETTIEIVETMATLPPEFSTSYLSALPWGQPFFHLDADVRQAKLADVQSRLRGYAQPDGNLRVPFKAIFATAQSPSRSELDSA